LKNGQYILTEDTQFDINKTYYEFSPNVVLDGTGNIIANTIQLGTGANIKNYIALGNAIIQNPTNPDAEEDNNRPFIVAGATDVKLEIYQDGLIKAGNITIDGPSSEIHGEEFSITPEVARFNNIVASGSIETAVFKQGSVQAAGGAMVFAPSYKIEAIKGRILTLDSDYQGEKGDVVWLAANGETSN
jgi:hypothetical protein